jgi:hypothetical protein
MTDTYTNTTTIAGVRSPSRRGRGAGRNLERACLVNQAEAGHRLREHLRAVWKEDDVRRAGYDALARAYGGMMNITGDRSGLPRRAKVYTGDYMASLTAWAATMMGLEKVRKAGRGQVINLAQFDVVAGTHGQLHAALQGPGSDVQAHRQPGSRLRTLRYLQA